MDRPFHLVRNVTRSNGNPSLRYIQWCSSQKEYATPIILLKNSLPATTTLAVSCMVQLDSNSSRLVHRFFVLHSANSVIKLDSLSWGKRTSMATVSKSPEGERCGGFELFKYRGTPSHSHTSRISLKLFSPSAEFALFIVKKIIVMV